MSSVPGQPPEPADQEARLADLLEACLRAEHGAPGSATEVVQGAPEELRDELADLLAVARALEGVEWPAATREFRAGARARFGAHAESAAAARTGAPTGLRRAAPWILRVAAGLATLVLAGFGGVIASTDSLPGQPLYAVKQADEFVTLSLTRDDLSRALVLLQQAGTRLDEAIRLAGAGQVQAAVDVLRQYVATLEGAAASLSRARGADPQARGEFDARLQQQLGQLESLARDAPQPLRASVEQAQAAARQELGRTEGPSGGVGQATPSPSASLSPSPAGSPSPGAPSRAPAVPPPSSVSSPVGEATPAVGSR